MTAPAIDVEALLSIGLLFANRRDEGQFSIIEQHAAQDRARAVLKAYLDENRPLIEAIKVYNFQPGDVLAFRTTRPIPLEAADRIREMARRQFPGVRAMVLSEGLELDVIRGLPAEVPA